MPVQDDIKPEKEKRQKRPPKKITARYLHNAGLAYLERFPASSSHFKAVMMRRVDKSCRHHPDQDRQTCAGMVDELVEKFRAMGLIDDDAYLRGMVISLRRRGLSALAIKARLMQKGLPAPAIAAALEEQAQESGDDFAAALRLARRKKIGPFRPPHKEARRDKELAALARSGYSYDIAEKVLSTAPDDADDILRSTG